MSKKIGLAVCYDTKNFGSQLQVLSNIFKIEELGYETEIIRYKKKITPAFIVQTIPRFFNIAFIQGKIAAQKRRQKIRSYPEIARNVAIRDKRFAAFAARYFTNLSKPYAGWETLVRESSQKYDLFLCGSDQLWLPQNWAVIFIHWSLRRKTSPSLPMQPVLA